MQSRQSQRNGSGSSCSTAALSKQIQIEFNEQFSDNPTATLSGAWDICLTATLLYTALGESADNS